MSVQVPEAPIFGLFNRESLKSASSGLLVRGIVGVLFAAVCFALTGATIFALTIWIGAFFLADGVITAVTAIRAASGGKMADWGWQLAGGLLGIAVGVMTFVWPGATALSLALLVSAWAIATGIFQLATAIQLAKIIPNDWLFALNGILSIVLGAGIAMYPGAGLVAITWMLGAYALISGISLIALSVRLRKLA